MRARLGLSERSWLFLLSLIIALTMWLYVTVVLNPQQERPTTASLLVRNVEVTFGGLRDGWKAAADPKAVDVELRGPVDVLKTRTTEVHAIADVATLEAGSYRVTLRVQVPPGVPTWQASPSAVQVTVTRP